MVCSYSFIMVKAIIMFYALDLNSLSLFKGIPEAIHKRQPVKRINNMEDVDCKLGQRIEIRGGNHIL